MPRFTDYGMAITVQPIVDKTWDYLLSAEPDGVGKLKKVSSKSRLVVPTMADVDMLLGAIPKALKFVEAAAKAAAGKRGRKPSGTPLTTLQGILQKLKEEEAAPRHFTSKNFETPNPRPKKAGQAAKNASSVVYRVCRENGKKDTVLAEAMNDYEEAEQFGLEEYRKAGRKIVVKIYGNEQMLAKISRNPLETNKTTIERHPHILKELGVPGYEDSSEAEVETEEDTGS